MSDEQNTSGSDEAASAGRRKGDNFVVREAERRRRLYMIEAEKAPKLAKGS